jgi:CubicO group peptidase (beta-lactamase class C family)
VAYSGGGYTVAEIALQDLMGLPFEQIMREWLLAPAGMRQAEFQQPLAPAKHGGAAWGHLASGEAVPRGWNNHPEQAAAGLWATASDLAVLLIEMVKGYRGESRLFTPAAIRELVSQPFDGHVYGFRLIGSGDGTFLTHYGGNVGYRAGLTLNLATGDGAVFLANSDNGTELGREFFGAVSREYGWPTFRGAQVTRASQPVEALQALVGRYRFPEEGWAVSVVFETQALTIVFPNGDRYAMTPIQGAPMEFIHPPTGVRATFDREGGGEPRLHLYGQVGRRLPDGSP